MGIRSRPVASHGRGAVQYALCPTMQTGRPSPILAVGHPGVVPYVALLSTPGLEAPFHQLVATTTARGLVPVFWLLQAHRGT